MTSTLEDHLLESYNLGNEDNIFDELYNTKHHQHDDYEGTVDRICDPFSFYTTQFNHISEIEGHDLMKKKDIDFSDFEAIQASLQVEGYTLNKCANRHTMSLIFINPLQP